MVRYLKPGQDFSASDFPKEFGFHGSNVGRDDPRAHPRIKTDPYGEEPGPQKNVRQPVNPSPQRLAGGGPAMPPNAGAPPPSGGPMQGALGALSQAAGQGQQEPTISMPVSTAAEVAKHLVQTGAMHGASAGAQAVARHIGAHRAPPGVPVAMPGRPTPSAAPPTAAPAPQAGMAEGGTFIQKAISRPHREQRRAHAAGRSVHEQMQHDSHSSDRSLRSAANLGLRLTKGDLSPHRKKGK